MKESAIYEQYQYIISLIIKKQLKEALEELKEYVADTPDWELGNKLERIQTSYTYMLRYMRQNATDPDRKKLHTKLLAETWEVAEQARIQKSAPTSTRYYYKTRDYLKSLPTHSIKTQLMEMEAYTEDAAMTGLLQEDTEKSSGDIRERHESSQHILFDLVWTNSAWNAQDEAEAREMLQSVLLPVNDLCLFTGAVTLSIMECFDLRKLMWLFDAYGHENVFVGQRALVGIAFAFQVHHKRMELYPEIVARISYLNESEQFGQDLSRIQIQMLRSQETEKIDKKMREEIIPEMLKSTNIQNMKFDFEESDEDSDDHNPDWLKELENSPLNDKLREMSELQMEGADVYMSTFSALKGYPFFKTLSNWFYPFDTQHSSVVKELNDKKENSLLDLILDSGLFCDSDKYSLCFTITHIPQMQRDAMISQLSEQQLGEMMDEQKSHSMKKFSEQPVTVSNQYLHNLYRFFRLYPRRHEFRDVFKESIRLNEYAILTPVLHKPEYLQNLAEYYFRKERYPEAATTYRSILELTGGTAEIYQKVGYCLQKEKKYEEAINAYLKSDMIKSDSIWTIRHLAACYRLNRSFEKALAYYYKMEEVQPENKNTTFNIGSCLAELEQYDDALKHFFKLDFINPNDIKVWRAIGWCSFAAGKPEQAMRYYEKIIEKHPLAPDYMNAGHTAWTLKEMEKAIGYYSKSIDMIQSKSQFRDMFYKDTPTLIRQGVNEDDIPLLLDLL